jgi:hypothetical protein
MLFGSNAMWIGSGYGVQGQSLLPRLAMLPEFGGRRNIAQFAWCGLENGIIEHQGFKTYPRMRHMYGNDAYGAWSRDFGANWVVSLIDTWVLKGVTKSVAPALWTPYMPVDMTPVPAPVMEGMEGCHLPLVFSKWGQAELTKVKIDAMYIPLGVEPSTYRILPDELVRSFRQTTLLNAEHLTIMVAANKAYPDRKFFQGQIRAWAAFAKDKPGARLYLHTDPTPNSGGIDIVAIARSLGILDKMMFPKPEQYAVGFPADYLALLYNAADMFMGAARGEGFGIPIVEAQSCGTPVVVTNFSSMPELVRWGHAVPYIDLDFSPLGSWQVIPDVMAIETELHRQYAEWEANGRMKNPEHRQIAQDAIHSEYGWDVIVRDFWGPLAARMAEECPPLDSKYQVAVPAGIQIQGEAGHTVANNRITPQVNGLHKLPVSKVDMPV